MQNLTKFILEYEKLKVLYPQLYFSINEFGEKNLWRISVFGRDLAIIGDAEFLTVEDTDREKAFEKALVKMRSIPSQIFNAIETKKSGREIYRKNKK